MAQWTKKLSGIITITVGSVGLDGPFMVDAIGEMADSNGNLGQLAQMIAAAEIDLVAVGRAMIANPDWANRVKAGRTDTLAAYDMSALAELY